MFKRMLSILLTLAMLLSMIPAGYAADIEIVDEPLADEDVVMVDGSLDEDVIMIDEAPEEPAPVKEPPVEPQASESGEERVITPLELDVEATAEIAEAGSYAYFSFTPETTDDYEFISMADIDTYGYLYDANWNEITHDDDSGGNGNFRVRQELTAGVTYYFGARYYSSSYTGSFPVKLSTYYNNHFSASAVQTDFYVSFNETAVLEVIATSDDPDKISYQWYVDDAAIEGETAATLTTAPITVNKTYYCIVNDGYGETQRVWFYVYIDTHFSARAVQSEIYVALNGTATLEVTATSDDPDQITYEWRALQKNYNEDGSYWTNWVVIDGATESSFVTPPVTERTEYYCYVYDGYGNSNSVWFNVYVDTNFSAEAVQSELRVAPNETATLEVNAASDDPDKISYRWYMQELNSDSGYWSGWTQIEGATDKLYTVAQVTNRTQYYCAVSDGYGTEENVFFDIYLETNFSAEAVQSEFRVAPNETVTLEVNASSVLPDKITYQWYTYDENWSRYAIDGATGSSYTTALITRASEYVCYVSDGYGRSDEIRFMISVETNFSAEAVQSDFRVAPNETVTLEVNATSDLPDGITYQWYAQERHYYEDGEGYWNQWVEIEGATDSSYTTAPVTQNTQYYCYVTDGVGGSRDIYFNISVETHLSARAVQREFQVAPNDTAVLEVSASSDDPDKIDYQWYALEKRSGENGESWTQWVQIEGATGSSFTTAPITEYSEFYCRVGDGYGNSQQVWFVVRVQTHFSAYAVKDQVYVSPNETATLEVSASSDDPDKITYQWYAQEQRSGENGESWTEWVRVEGETGSSFITSPITKRTDYYCAVSDGYGYTESVWFYVYIQNHFTASAAEDDNVWVPLNDSAVLQVIASSDDPDKITYQWYREEKVYHSDNVNEYHWESTEIPGATGSSFTTDPVTEETRLYCCVEDGYGAVISVWFYVYVDSHFSAEPVNQDVYVAPNETAALEVNATSDAPERITYQWYREQKVYRSDDINDYYWENKLIEGATDSSLITDEITEYSRYSCAVSDGYGYTTNVEFHVYIDSHFVARAAQGELRVARDSTADLEVIATSDTPEKISYQWYVGQRRYYSGGNYGIDWIAVEGATGSTLTTAPITEHTEYRCNVSDGYGYTREIWFNVYIDTHFSVQMEKYEYTVPSGDMVTLTVNATSDDPDKISYQWCTIDKNWNWQEIEGATGSSYTAGPITKYQHYGCMVSDGYGTNRGVDCQVTVDYTDQIPDLALPLTLNTPTDAVIEGDCEYAFYYFVPEESDYYILTAFSERNTYAKLYNAQLQEINNSSYGGEGSNFYLEHRLTAGQTYYYAVRFEDRSSGTIPIILRISNDLRAHAANYNNNVRVPNGETAELAVVAEARDTSMITYQWSKLERVTHTEWDGSTWVGEEWVEIEGATESSYTTSAVTENSQYQCLVEDGYGGRTTVRFEVGVDTHFTARAKQSNLSVSLGSTAELEVIANSDFPDQITYTWYKAEKHYYSDTDWGWSWGGDNVISGETSSTLTTPEIDEYQAFLCIVADGYGNEDHIWFYVSVDTGFRAWNDRTEYRVAPETELTLEAFATSNAPELITYQWYEYVDYTWVPLKGETASTFDTGAITAERQLECRVSDGYGTETRLTYRILIETHLSAYAKEREITVPLNGTATLQVIASCDLPDAISYEWIDGQDVTIEGENGPTISVGPMTGETWYRCHVTDGYGGFILVTFHVTIDTGFYAYARENPIRVAPGAKATLEVVAGADDPTQLSFEWYRSTRRQYDPTYWEWGNGTLLEGETGPTLTTDAINELSLYYCIVSDGVNEPAWISFEIYVNSRFQVQLEDETQTVYVPYEQTAQLEVPIVTNYPDKLKIQWYRGELYSYMGNYWIVDEKEVEGATNASLTTEPVTGPIGYLCIIDDGFGNNAIIYFNVFPQTNLTAKAEQETIYVNAGDSVTARVIASSDDPEQISYQWYESPQFEYNGQVSNEWMILDDATEAEYPLTDVRGYHKLGCLVSDGYGNSVMVVVCVYVQNHFGAEAVNPKNRIGINDRVELKLNVHGDDLTGLSYAWYRWTYIGMGMGYYDYMRINGADGSSLLAGTDFEKYRCVVTDRYGTPVEVDFEVHIGEKPDGYTVTLTDYTKGGATVIGVDNGGFYSGSVPFTVAAASAVVVAVKDGDGYTLLECKTSGDTHSFTVNVTGDTEIVLAFKGDANLDGKVTTTDGTMIKRAAMKTYTFDTPLKTLVSDVNGDGTVRTTEGTMVSRAAMKTYTLPWSNP